jgi:hypothetical protein
MIEIKSKVRLYDNFSYVITEWIYNEINYFVNVKNYICVMLDFGLRRFFDN